MFEGITVGNEAELKKVEVLADLQNTKDIRIKTDVSMLQIGTMLKIRNQWRIVYKNTDMLDVFLEEFMQLRLSNKRQSRKEITDTIKSMVEEREEHENISSALNQK